MSKNNSWEKEFDKVFENYRTGKGLIYSQYELKKALKSFISSLLKEQRTELIEEIVGISNPYPEFTDSYNAYRHALSDVLDSLERKNGKVS